MKALPLFLLAALLLSCGESYEQKDPSRLNELLAKMDYVTKPEQVMELYYTYPSGEGTKRRTVDVVELGENLYEVTLIHEGLADDSQAGVKIVMKVQQEGNRWQALEIKKNWRCYDGRGHTDWGTDNCQ